LAIGAGFSVRYSKIFRKKYLVQVCSGDRPVVEHTIHNPKIKGSNPAATTGR